MLKKNNKTKNWPITVITINYNDCEGLKKTFESVFDQSYENFEYIVIDGGSTDGSKELIELNNDRINYWVSETDDGIYNAMNKGITMANGEYCIFMNSGDCFFNKEILEVFSLNMSKNDFVYGNMIAEDNEGKRKEYLYPNELNLEFFSTGFLAHQAIFTKTDILKEFRGYRQDLKILSDWDFYAKGVLLRNLSYQHIDKFVTVFNREGISGHKAFLEKKKKN
ncbi:glycosyltransferase family 2 protein [Formosa haliotis]|uniref:glycosyltransferase family 2 protein n=1 Tax=Formosa haliotis TaxID=1555194 RepID=UPI00082627FB|nr:glycosyltransferase family 2 protein [Formosa haliotis]